jgi:hypothetical protein
MMRIEGNDVPLRIRVNGKKGKIREKKEERRKERKRERKMEMED